MAAQRGSPRAASYFHISDNLYIKIDNNDKKGNLGNQWQSLISSPISSQANPVDEQDSQNLEGRDEKKPEDAV